MHTLTGGLLSLLSAVMLLHTLDNMPHHSMAVNMYMLGGGEGWSVK